MKNNSCHSDLITLCKQNNRLAQFKIYKLYSRSMYNTSYRILNHSAEAEDAMQEAFLSAFASISNYDHNIPFGSWLKRIVINKAIDQFRKKKEFTFPDDKNNEMYESNAEEWTSDDYSEKEKQEIITAIHQAICTLPDGYRIIFSLYHLEGYDHQEIASITGISEPASRSQLTRARKQLRERLGNNKLIMKYRKCYG